MIQDVINSIKVTLHERFSNPLLGSFLISSIGFNYHFFLIIFSDEKVTDKMALIGHHFDPSRGDVWLRLIIYPSAIAAIYLFILPYPSRWVYEFVRNRQKEILDIRRKTEDEFPLTQTEARELRAKHYQLENYYQALLKERDEKAAIALQSKVSQEQYVPAGSPLPNDQNQNGQISLWDEDFKDFINSEERTEFEKELTNIFSNSLTTDSLQYYGNLAAWGLVDKEEDNYRIFPTEKGKYFAKKLMRHKSNRSQSNALTNFQRLCVDIISSKNLQGKLEDFSQKFNELRQFFKTNHSDFKNNLPAELMNTLDDIDKEFNSMTQLVKKGNINNIIMGMPSFIKPAEQYIVAINRTPRI